MIAYRYDQPPHPSGKRLRFATASLALATFSLDGPLNSCDLFRSGRDRLFRSGGRRARALAAIVPGGNRQHSATWNSSRIPDRREGGRALGRGLYFLKSTTAAYLIAAVAMLTFGLSCDSGEVSVVTRRAAADGFHNLAALRFVWSTKSPVRRSRAICSRFSLRRKRRCCRLDGAEYLPSQDRPGFVWLRAAPRLARFLMGMWLAHRPRCPKAGRDMLLAVAGLHRDDL